MSQSWKCNGSGFGESDNCVGLFGEALQVMNSNVLLRLMNIYEDGTGGSINYQATMQRFFLLKSRFSLGHFKSIFYIVLASCSSILMLFTMKNMPRET